MNSPAHWPMPVRMCVEVSMIGGSEHQVRDPDAGDGAGDLRRDIGNDIGLGQFLA